MKSFFQSKSVILIIVLTAGGCLTSGFILPVLNVEQFYIFDKTFSLWSAMVQLFDNGDYFIGIVIFLFTFLFPIIKLVLCIWLTLVGKSDDDTTEKTLKVLELTGKWSMLDVFVIALLLLMTKTSVLATAKVQIGLYLFAAAVLLTTTGSQLLKYRLKG